MLITEEKIDEIEYFAGDNRPLATCRKILRTLMEELEDCNEILGDVFGNIKIYYYETHDEYSPERVDPCPDKYGGFSLRSEKTPCNTLGADFLTLDELDSTVLLLSDLADLAIEFF